MNVSKKRFFDKDKKKKEKFTVNFVRKYLRMHFL